MRLLLWFCLFPFFLPGQSQQFASWSLEAGLPQSQVYALCEDRRGYLWAGTQGGGLCRFDGSDFLVFAEREGLPSNFVNALYEDWNGHLWAGTNEGAAFWDGRQLHEVRHSLAVSAFVQIDSGRLLLGTAQGVWQYVFKTKQLSKFPLSDLLDKIPVQAFCFDAKNRTVWLATPQGVWYYHVNHQKLVNFNAQHKLPVQPARAFAQVGETLWFAQANGVLVAADLNTQTVKRTFTNPALGNPTCLLADVDGSLWAGTQTAGLLRLLPEADSVLTRLTEAEGLPHNHLRVLLRDHAGRLWLGTSGGGFACLRAQAFQRYDRGDGLPGNRIYALTESPVGDLWLAVSQNGLASLNAAGQVQPVTLDSAYLQGVKCRTLATDAGGRLWAGTEGKGALCMGKGRRQFFRKDNGFLPSDWVQKICCDAKGRVWVATGEGLVSLTPIAQDSGWAKQWYTPREGMPPGAVTALQIDQEGNAWFGLANGKLGLVQNGKITAVFGPEQGLAGFSVTSIAIDAIHRCWVATKGGGIFVKNASKNARFTAVEGPPALSSQNIYLLVFDRVGNLWAGTENGVDRCVLQNGQLSAVTHFGKREGFSGIETCQDAGLCDRNGQLWFGTMNGLMRHLPQVAAKQDSPPLLHFEQTMLYYKPIEQTPFALVAERLFNGREGGLSLPWNQNHLSFAFRAVDPLYGMALRYRWKLEGPDADWSPWSSQTQVNYANLAPGTYRFLAQAASDDHTFSQPIAATFTIRQPFWQEWYFRLGVLALLAALVIGGVRIYIQRIRSSEARRREQLEVQNRLLQLEQKALQLQMNPHFIFNALNSIQSLIAMRDYAVARQEINHFAKLMRNILNNSRKTTISLQEEIETLEQYLHIEQFCQQNPFTFTVQTAPDVDPENIDLPPMLLQPFVENAVVHGVSHLPYPGHIDLQFDLQGGWLVCMVRDNGPGREKAALLREAKKPGHQSAALSVTKERLAAIGGSLELRDRHDAQHVVSGTEVELRIRVF